MTDLPAIPHDNEAERHVIAGVLEQPDLWDELSQTVRADMFYATPHKCLWGAIVECAANGGIGHAQVAVHLQKAEKLKQVGGVAYIDELALNVPLEARDVVLEHAAIVRTKWQLRNAIREANRLLSVVKSGAGPEEVLDQFRQSAHSLEQETTRAEIIEWSDTLEIFEPLPPINWLCKDLQLAPGRPNLLAGHNFSGKSMFAACVAFAVASGQLVWNKYGCRPGYVLHLNYDQGDRIPKRRYQRMAAAVGMAPQDLHGRLYLATRPKLKLDDPGAYDYLARRCEGAAFLIVDSLRACTRIDENDSRIREPLDVLTDVSEATGCTMLMVHHARKPSVEQRGKVAKFEVRGSSAIIDACENVFCLQPEKRKPTKVVHEKAGITGVCLEDFELTVLDVEVDSNPRGGLAVTCNECQPPIPLDEKEKVDERKAKGTELVAAVMNLFTAEPVQRSADAIALKLGKRAADVRAALTVLTTGPDAPLVDEGYGRARTISLRAHLGEGSE